MPNTAPRLGIVLMISARARIATSRARQKLLVLIQYGRDIHIPAQARGGFGPSDVSPQSRKTVEELTPLHSFLCSSGTILSSSEYAPPYATPGRTQSLVSPNRFCTISMMTLSAMMYLVQTSHFLGMSERVTPVLVRIGPYHFEVLVSD